MQWFAGEGRIGTEAFEGAIPITEKQYSEALAGMIAGKIVTVVDGFVVAEPPSPPAEPPPPELTPEEVEASNRAQRDSLLRESDWTQLEDAPADKARWAIYRQSLRDLDMTNPDWPSKPEGDVSEAEKLRAEKALDRAARTILFDGKNKA